ncbi:hypothetical protein [Mycobacterium arosiense]|uniref:hypothetical protein n=1 Tax=Mycobacterium arosiense TaxID=425468 RepID=UPI001151625B|nr:hypothetical protein [Mycobacterium arosiense]
MPVDLHAFTAKITFSTFPAMAPDLQARIPLDHAVRFIIAGAECGVERADLFGGAGFRTLGALSRNSRGGTRGV